MGGGGFGGGCTDIIKGCGGIIGTIFWNLASFEVIALARMLVRTIYTWCEDTRR